MSNNYYEATCRCHGNENVARALYKNSLKRDFWIFFQFFGILPNFETLIHENKDLNQKKKNVIDQVRRFSINAENFIILL